MWVISYWVGIWDPIREIKRDQDRERREQGGGATEGHGGGVVEVGLG